MSNAIVQTTSHGSNGLLFVGWNQDQGEGQGPLFSGCVWLEGLCRSCRSLYFAHTNSYLTTYFNQKFRFSSEQKANII